MSEQEVILMELQGNTQETWDFHRVAEQLGGNEYLDVSHEVPGGRRKGKRGPSPEDMDAGPRLSTMSLGASTRSRSPAVSRGSPHSWSTLDCETFRSDCETFRSDCETFRSDCETWIVKLKNRIVNFKIGL